MFIEKIKKTIKTDNLLYKIPNTCLYLIRNSMHQAAFKRFRHLCEHLPEITSEPFFVKVGANDGITGDPCSDILLKNAKWKGLLIEPVPYCFDRLKENFNDSNRFILERVAIGQDTGKKRFYYVDKDANKSIPDLPYWYDQAGSFDKKHILKLLDGILSPFIIECEIEVITLSSVLESKGIQDIQLLHIDTESYDLQVLKTLDFDRYTPNVIYLRHLHHSKADKKEMLHLLRKNGYTTHDCGENYLAINKEANERLR